MRVLASLSATVLALLLGLAAAAQASDPVCEYAVIECQRIPGGGVEVIMISNNAGGAPQTIEVGDDCSAALDRLANDEHDFFLQAATSGSSDKTVYTWRSCGVP